MQPGPLDRHVDAEGRGGQRELLAQQHRVGAGHLELDGRDRVVGDPHDPVDVAAVVGDAAGDARQRGGAQRVPEHRDVAAAAAVRALVGVAGGDLDLHAQRCQRRLQRGPDPALGAAGGAQQDAEHQPAPDHHLLDVHDGRVQAGQRRRTALDVTPGRSRPVTVTSSAPAVLWFLSMTGQRYCRARPGRGGPPGGETGGGDGSRARGQGRCGDRGRGRHRSGRLPGAGRRGDAGRRGLPAGPGGGRSTGSSTTGWTSPRPGAVESLVERAVDRARLAGPAGQQRRRRPRSGTASCPPPTTTGSACSRST